MAELGLEGFVDALDKLLGRTIKVMGPIGVFLRLVSFRDDKIINRFRSWIRCLDRLGVSIEFGVSRPNLRLPHIGVVSFIKMAELRSSTLIGLNSPEIIVIVSLSAHPVLPLFLRKFLCHLPFLCIYRQ
jgi:hypothetical protein